MQAPDGVSALAVSRVGSVAVERSILKMCTPFAAKASENFPAVTVTERFSPTTVATTLPVMPLIVYDAVAVPAREMAENT